MAVDPVTIAAYVFGLLMLYVAARLLLIPARFLVQLAVHVVTGAILLLVLNGVDAHVAGVDVSLPLNPVTAMVAGFLGLPGLVGLLALRHWLVAPVLPGPPLIL